MDLDQLHEICIALYGERGGEVGKQRATGAAGHLKNLGGGTIEEKTMYYAKQSGPTSTVAALKEVGEIPEKYRNRKFVDCRESIKNKSETTGYHAEMIIVRKWLLLAFPAWKDPKDIDPKDKDQVKAQATLQGQVHTKFMTLRGMIAANAQCCKHCHHMLDHLNITHRKPDPIKSTNTGWWNPLNNTVYANGDMTEFAKNIPGF